MSPLETLAVVFVLILGMTTILYKSTLLDPLRKLVMNYLDLTEENLFKNSPRMDKPLSKIALLAWKLMGCWICVSFWSGVALSVLGFIPIGQPLLAGAYSVGLMSLFKFSDLGKNY